MFISFKTASFPGGIMTLASEVLGTLEHLIFKLMEHRNTSKKLNKNWNLFDEEISTKPEFSSKSKFLNVDKIYRKQFIFFSSMNQK